MDTRRNELEALQALYNALQAEIDELYRAGDYGDPVEWNGIYDSIVRRENVLEGYGRRIGELRKDLAGV